MAPVVALVAFLVALLAPAGALLVPGGGLLANGGAGLAPGAALVAPRGALLPTRSGAASPSSAAPPSSLVFISSRQASLIQWVLAGNHLSGTYDGLAVQSAGAAYSTEQAHCEIAGTEDGSAISLTLSGCTNAATDGSFFSRLDAAGLLLEVPSGNGSVTGLQFVPGSYFLYDEA
ncbi:MAG TPA: hypothetical protein VMD59_15410, partial [Acidimicrobiales bacterium]|nr:hypothetical protein [Acidimicrobiales bacterium]